MENLSWLATLVSSAVSTVALVVLVRQLSLLRKQISDDHERSRREKALELLAKWTDFVCAQGGTAPANFAQMLTSDKLRHSSIAGNSRSLRN